MLGLRENIYRLVQSVKKVWAKGGKKWAPVPNQSFFEPLGVASWNDRLLIGGMDFRQQRFQAHTLGILS